MYIDNFLIFYIVDEFVKKGFELITKEKGPADCGTSLSSCENGDEAFQIERCISKGCNLIQWCPDNGKGLDEPSCHHRHGGQSRACLYKDCKKCTKDSCNYRDPNSISGKVIGHWYTYFKEKGNIFA